VLYVSYRIAKKPSITIMVNFLEPVYNFFMQRPAEPPAEHKRIDIFDPAC
jgi:hypothetical protein